MPADSTNDRRAAILTAAARLFAGGSFRSVSMADIGVATGMSAASLYRFFDGKASILAALWDDALSELIRSAEVAMAESANPDQQLELIVRTHATLLVGKYADVGHLVRRGNSELSPAHRAAIEAKELHYFELWIPPLGVLLDPATEPAELHNRIFVALAILHSVTGTELEFADDVVIDQLVAMTMAAVLSDGSGNRRGR
jgi:AcrR family transcriptional regulator